MEDFLLEMAEILEVDSVDRTDELNNFESWDSLATLSVAAFAEGQFGVTISSQEINEATTIEDLYQRIVAKKSA